MAHGTQRRMAHLRSFKSADRSTYAKVNPPFYHDPTESMSVRKMFWIESCSCPASNEPKEGDIILSRRRREWIVGMFTPIRHVQDQSRLHTVLQPANGGRNDQKSEQHETQQPHQLRCPREMDPDSAVTPAKSRRWNATEVA
jgi:hypothetical protein